MSTSLCTAVFFIQHVSADVKALPKSGAVSSIWGYPGLSYQAIQYELLCGTFGPDGIYGSNLDISDSCTPAIDAYENITETFAIYDSTGLRVQDVGIGEGRDLCECFSLQRQDGATSDFCFWVTGTGRVNVNDIIISAAFTWILDSSYRPASAKALPMCAGQDLQSLKSQWSATRFETATQGTTSSPASSGNMKTETVFTTEEKTVLTTEKDTVLTTETKLETRTQPVSTAVTDTVLKTETKLETRTQTVSIAVTNTGTTMFTSVTTRTLVSPASATTVIAAGGPAAGQGYNNGDQIALGVGIGIGVPTMILMVLLKYGKRIADYLRGTWRRLCLD